MQCLDGQPIVQTLNQKNKENSDMYFTDQKSFEEYRSPATRTERIKRMVATRELAISEAFELYRQGDIEAARYRLFDAGIGFDGIVDYLNIWAN
ncbi:hypothetical protein AAKU58_004469 [Oxalobacteraceae bacterium GrIS 1.18]